MKISNIIFDKPSFLPYWTLRGCLLEAFGGWDNLWSLLYNLRVSLNQKVFHFKNYFEKVSVQVLLILCKMVLMMPPIKQQAILGVTTILVASRSDFKVLWGVHCHFRLEFEDIATFCSFKPPWVLVERYFFFLISMKKDYLHNSVVQYIKAP